MATESPGATSGEANPTVVDTPLQQTSAPVAEVAPVQQHHEPSKQVEETPATISNVVMQNPEEEVKQKEAEKEESEVTDKSEDVAGSIVEESLKEDVIIKVEETVDGAGMLILLLIVNDALFSNVVEQSKRNR